MRIKRLPKTVSIYALADPRSWSVKYVGKSYDAEYRLQQHTWPCHLRGDTPRARWLRALSRDGLKPVLIVLETVSADQWGEAERRWIEKMRADGQVLLNGTNGGPGGYSESRWQRQRVKGPVTRKSRSGLLGVLPTSSLGGRFKYWTAHVSLNGKHWRKTFPFTDEGKLQAAEWYEQSKRLLEQGLEPVIAKRTRQPYSGVVGLVRVRKYKERFAWYARLKVDGKFVGKFFPDTDEGKAAATEYLAELKAKYPTANTGRGLG